jgi:hypothetical protein
MSTEPQSQDNNFLREPQKLQAPPTLIWVPKETRGPEGSILLQETWLSLIKDTQAVINPNLKYSQHMLKIFKNLLEAVDISETFQKLRKATTTPRTKWADFGIPNSFTTLQDLVGKEDKKHLARKYVANYEEIFDTSAEAILILEGLRGVARKFTSKFKLEEKTLNLKQRWADAWLESQYMWTYASGLKEEARGVLFTIVNEPLDADWGKEDEKEKKEHKEDEEVLVPNWNNFIPQSLYTEMYRKELLSGTAGSGLQDFLKWAEDELEEKL